MIIPQTVLALRGSYGVGLEWSYWFFPRPFAPRVRSRTMCFTVLRASYLRHSAVEWSVAAVWLHFNDREWTSWFRGPPDASNLPDASRCLLFQQKSCLLLLSVRSVWATIGGQKKDGGLASTSFGAEFRCGSCGMGLTGSLPLSKKCFATKNVGIEESVGRNGGRKT